MLAMLRMLKSRGNRNQIAARAYQAAPVGVAKRSLAFGRHCCNHTADGDDMAREWHTGFFGEGMP